MGDFMKYMPITLDDRPDGLSLRGPRVQPGHLHGLVRSQSQAPPAGPLVHPGLSALPAGRPGQPRPDVVPVGRPADRSGHALRQGRTRRGVLPGQRSGAGRNQRADAPGDQHSRDGPDRPPDRGAHQALPAVDRAYGHERRLGRRRHGPHQQCRRSASGGRHPGLLRLRDPRTSFDGGHRRDSRRRSPIFRAPRSRSSGRKTARRPGRP